MIVHSIKSIFAHVVPSKVDVALSLAGSQIAAQPHSVRIIWATFICIRPVNWSMNLECVRKQQKKWTCFAFNLLTRQKWLWLFNAITAMNTDSCFHLGVIASCCAITCVNKIQERVYLLLHLFLVDFIYSRVCPNYRYWWRVRTKIFLTATWKISRTQASFVSMRHCVTDIETVSDAVCKPQYQLFLRESS